MNSLCECSKKRKKRSPKTSGPLSSAPKAAVLRSKYDQLLVLEGPTRNPPPPDSFGPIRGPYEVPFPRIPLSGSNPWPPTVRPQIRKGCREHQPVASLCHGCGDEFQSGMKKAMISSNRVVSYDIISEGRKAGVGSVRGSGRPIFAPNLPQTA